MTSCIGISESSSAPLLLVVTLIMWLWLSPPWTGTELSDAALDGREVGGRLAFDRRGLRVLPVGICVPQHCANDREERT